MFEVLVSLFAAISPRFRAKHYAQSANQAVALLDRTLDDSISKLLNDKISLVQKLQKLPTKDHGDLKSQADKLLSQLSNDFNERIEPLNLLTQATHTAALTPSDANWQFVMHEIAKQQRALEIVRRRALDTVADLKLKVDIALSTPDDAVPAPVVITAEPLSRAS